jgi:hypothetical protein
MSDTCVNIRVLYWHFQITTHKTFRFSFNDYWWQLGKARALLNPIACYEFDLSRWGSDEKPVYKVGK